MLNLRKLIKVVLDWFIVNEDRRESIFIIKAISERLLEGLDRRSKFKGGRFKSSIIIMRVK